ALRVVALCSPPEDGKQNEEANRDEAADQLIGCESGEFRVENPHIHAKSDGSCDQLRQSQCGEIANQQHETVGERRQAGALRFLAAAGNCDAFEGGESNGGCFTEGRQMFLDRAHYVHAWLYPIATVSS